MSPLIAQHFQHGQTVRITIEDGQIRGLEALPGVNAEVWVAPAFWDIQTNGRWGVSYSDPAIRPDQVAEIVRVQAALGTARLCPTLITAPFDAFVTGLKAIASACDADPVVDAMVIGVHLEGPYLSAVDGYRGAHSLDSIRPPDWDEFQRFQEASGGRVVLVTLAPEWPGAMKFIERVVAAGVVVSLGHSAADPGTIREAVAAGATLSTHLGNGIAAQLARHPNPIWEQAAIDDLYASVIADGHHLDPATLKVLVRAKSVARTILVSDASPLAGLPPGPHGEWAVDPSGKIVVSGTPYLAGSNQAIEVGLNTLLSATGITLEEAMATVTTNPARLFGKREPAIEPGLPANLVVFQFDGERIRLLRCCVDGQWVEASDAPRPHRILLA